MKRLVVWSWAAMVVVVIAVVLSLSTFCLADESEQARGIVPSSEQPDFNRDIYYRNKLELAYDMGVLWYNTPLLLDGLIGDRFHRLAGTVDYTLIPLNLALRWDLYGISGRLFWRGNTEVMLGGTYTVIEQGPESYYYAIFTGARYNFIQPNWRMVPYFEVRMGMGFTDAQQPYEVKHHLPAVGQGEDFTFTFGAGTGIRYNFSPRYSFSLGVGYMHISNLYLSTPKYYNHGINVVGPTAGLTIALPTFSEAWQTLSQGVRIPLGQIAQSSN